MNDIKISVILPVFNVEKYLNKCIDSILNQTFKYFELIIINDGSTDNSGTICNNYFKSDSRIKVINQENLGLSVARNKGIDLAKGKYITFIDSDDYIDSKYFEILYTIIEKNNADIVMCNKIDFKENESKEELNIKNYNEKIISKEEAYKEMLIGKKIYIYAWAKLYKTSILRKNKFSVGKIYEDLYIINDLIEAAKKIVMTNYNGYYYLKRKNSITNEKFKFQHLDLLEASKKFTNFTLKNYPKLKNYITKSYIEGNFVIYKKIEFNKNFKKEYCSIRKEILKYKKEIFRSKLYSKKEKFQTFLLLFGNTPYKIFYKIYKKTNK